MERVMKRWALVSGLLTLAGTGLFLLCKEEVLLTIAITAGTVFYHVSIRLLIGWVFDRFLNNRADLHNKWYQTAPREKALYEKLRVKQWKKKMPTYDAALFDPALHSWTDIARAMCQAELVHEVNAAASLVSLSFSVWFGAFPVFLITSVLAAGYDLLFAILQRYNRPRVLRLAAGQTRRSKHNERAVENEKV
jgi:hypothetical protein